MLDFHGIRTQLHQCLFGSVLPFWMEHGIDPSGGLNTCLREDGTPISRDKWLWSQWRAVWVFSRLYNAFGHDEQWLNVARHIYDFSRTHGWDERSQGWVLRVGHDGAVLKGCESIYVDAFAMYGLTEFAKATGEREPIELARRTAQSVLQRLKQPHDQIPHFPYPIPAGARVHGLPMMFSLVFWELGQFLNEATYQQAAREMSDDIFTHFYRPHRDVVLERIAVDGSEFAPPRGTAVVPGHVIEDMWFQIHIARDQQQTDRIQQCCQLIRRHMELGWDQTHGGLLLAVDADGRSDVGWDFADTKLWWPHTEAMYALLLAYELTGESWALQWYDRVHRYSFDHFPVVGGREWRQKLDRQGQPISTVVALPVKDPFHLPRALMYCLEVLDRMDPPR